MKLESLIKVGSAWYNPDEVDWKASVEVVSIDLGTSYPVHYRWIDDQIEGRDTIKQFLSSFNPHVGWGQFLEDLE